MLTTEKHTSLILRIWVDERFLRLNLFKYFRYDLKVEMIRGEIAKASLFIIYNVYDIDYSYSIVRVIRLFSRYKHIFKCLTIQIYILLSLNEN